MLLVDRADDIEQADVVLIGISRTSKTPTSIYLANRGIKTANVPIVLGVPMPESLNRAKKPLIVGLIASIRRVLVVTLQSSEAMHGKDWSPEKQALFQASMIELGVLAGLILAMVASIFLLHRARDDGRPAGVQPFDAG